MAERVITVNGTEYKESDFYRVGRVLLLKPATLETLRRAFSAGAPWAGHQVYAREGNWYQEQHDNPDSPYWKSWESALESGRSYMVGRDVPMPKYIRSHRSPLTGWQKVAYDLALANPGKTFCLENGVNSWRVAACGDFVHFELPYHGEGGERSYISQNGRSKILVNVD